VNGAGLMIWAWAEATHKQVAATPPDAMNSFRKLVMTDFRRVSRIPSIAKVQFLSSSGDFSLPRS
jgi:hypothetical protein